MGAEDTVMDELEMRIVLNRASRESPTIPLSYHSAIAETQAEITWDKAIREVVGWVDSERENQNPSVWYSRWQAKKKEWRIE